MNSEVGCQQGDPCGPLLFALTIQPIINELISDFNLWYLDDGSLCDNPDTVLNDFKTLIDKAKEEGLEINPSKCELFFCSGEIDTNILNQFEAIAPGIRVISKENLNLLGAPIFDESFETFALNILGKMELMFERLTNLNAHTAFFLLKNCLAIPKLTYLLRTSQAWKFPNFTKAYDLLIKNTLESILNIKLDNKQWIQATLPVTFSGLGIRKLEDICLPAFLSSTHGVVNIVSQIIKTQTDNFSISHFDEAMEQWNIINDLQTPLEPNFQRNWDLLMILKTINEKLSYESPIDLARFKALQCKESGAWLQAYPSKNIGTFLDNNTLQTCMALRLGCPIFHPHKCICGSEVDKYGLHGLSCQKSQGQLPKHKDLNNIIWRTLSSIDIPAKLEPEGLSRDDGKRPDGLTLIPWSKGQHLIWDATCVDTLAISYLEKTSSTAGSAAELAATKKHNLYKKLKSSNYILIAFAVETLGPWCKEAKKFFDIIGSKLINKTGDKRSKNFLMQQISLSIQRGNATSMMGTLPLCDNLDSVFYI